MKNLSIRTRILVLVVVVNLLGAVGMMIYLHQSYSRSLDDASARTVTRGVAAWEQLSTAHAVADLMAEPKKVVEVLDSMKAITGAEYTLLLNKEATDKAAYTAARQALGAASAWEERDTYALLAATDEDIAEKARFELPPTEIPENGRVVGVEVGACTKTCHDGVTGEGDFWTIRWSTDRSSTGHAVFPVLNKAGDAIGVIYIVADISEQADAANDSMMQTLLVVAITLIVATLVIGMALDLLVLRRLASMTAKIQAISVRVAGGDFSARYEHDARTDEIGSFEKFFSEFVELVSAALTRGSK